MTPEDDRLLNALRSSQSNIFNPAVEAERERLELRALDTLRKWGCSTIVERAFFGDIELQSAVKDLLMFEARHVDKLRWKE